MKAIILAAGYSTRLYPLTETIAKPLLPIGEKKMMDFLMEKLLEVDVDEVFVIVNNKFYSDFLDWSKQFPNVKLINNGTNSNEERLGAVGDLAFAFKHAEIEDDCLIIGGDNLFGFSLKALEEMLTRKKSSVVAVHDLLDMKKLANRFGVVEVDANSRIIGFEEKPSLPKTSLASTLLYALTHEDLKKVKTYINSSQKIDNVGDLIRYLSEQGEVYAYIFKESWLDIGTIEDYEKVKDGFL